ncbi:MAG TPA: DUF1028 domain-containing protein, partial [Polyangiales bacterium]
CVYPSQVSIVFGVAPGFGAVHAQARANAAGRDRAAQLLSMGQAPADIIAAITASSFDASAPQRQYGVVDVMGRSAGYTGAQNSAFADDVQGSAQGYAYSVQGNILTGAEVLEQAALAFEGQGCDLAERLMLALEAGAANGQGDTRCTGPSDIAANSAFIQVDLPGMPAGSYLKLSAGSGRDVDPLPALRSAFDAWRSTHPCALTDAGAADAGSSKDGGADGATRDAALGADARAEGAPADAAPVTLDASLADAASPAQDAGRAPLDAAALADAGSMAEAGATGAPLPQPQPSESADESGCSAGAVRGTSGPLGLLLVPLGLLLWRSRRKRSPR